MHLKNGAALQGGKYRIIKVLGAGTFGVTYLAKTKVSGNFGTIETSVAIKEFFSSELNTRLEDGSVREMSDSSLASKYLKKFADEAGKISLLKDHPGIVNVLETFSENNTCYYVMEYKDGGSLREYIDSKGGVSETEGIEIIKKIADALSYMHSHKMLHLDLKPGNVMMDSDGSLCLIDFGLSRHFENEESESTTGIGLGTVGYAPIEQAGYNSADARKDIPVTIDIYALGATFYKILTGKTPPPSYELLQYFPDAALKAKGVSSMTIEAIKRAMAPIPSSRPQTVEEFLSLLDDDNLDSELLSKSETIKGEPCVIDKTQVVPEKEEPKKESSVQEENTEPKSRKWIWWLLIILLAAGLSLLLFRNNPSSSTDNLSEPTGMHEGYGYVDLGLSVRWATHNLGASDVWDCGELYAWGETSVKDNTSRNCRTYGHDYGGSGSEGARNPVWSYCGVPEYDAATTNWGGDWRMPTHEDFRELIDNCTWKWTTINGREGYKVTSKKNGNSIFLPAADNSDQSSEDARVGYWSASDVGEVDIEFAQFLCISPDTYSLEWEDRFAGLNVRPVLPALAQRKGYNGGCVDRIELNKYYRLMHEGLKYEDEGRLEDAYKNFQSALEIENEWDSAEDYFLFDLDAAKALNRVADQVYKDRHNGHEWVDLGLSVKWATCNVGASSPGDYGNYYAWGETKTKSSYTEDNCASFGKSWGDIGGNSSRDAARANWGGSWRMPTKSELEELQDNCTWAWTKQNGHKGYKVTSKKNGQSIFLPAAGHPEGDTFVNLGKNGYYWSSTPDTPGTLNACQLRLDIEGHKVVGSSRRYRFSVRPVLD